MMITGAIFQVYPLAIGGLFWAMLGIIMRIWKDRAEKERFETTSEQVLQMGKILQATRINCSSCNSECFTYSTASESLIYVCRNCGKREYHSVNAECPYCDGQCYTYSTAGDSPIYICLNCHKRHYRINYQ